MNIKALLATIGLFLLLALASWGVVVNPMIVEIGIGVIFAVFMFWVMYMNFKLIFED